jgi:hypothetical protein
MNKEEETDFETKIRKKIALRKEDLDKWQDIPNTQISTDKKGSLLE